MGERPHYEAPEDRISEEEIARLWASAGERKVKFFKLPTGPRYAIDFGFFHAGKLVAVAEVKDRTGWELRNGTVWLGASKVKELYEYDQLGIPAYFIVRLLGEIYFTQIDKRILDRDYYSISWGGTTKRNDPKDKEPCYNIPFGSLTKCIPQP